MHFVSFVTYYTRLFFVQMRQNSGSKKTQGFDKTQGNLTKTQGILPKIGVILTKIRQFEGKFCIFLQNFAEIT